MIQWDDLFAMVLSVVLGAVIGLERQFHRKTAGLRTNILICMGAAIFTIMSKYMAGSSEDSTRIAAQVVTGIGFLGAGAIIRDPRGVQGLTTAATIWLVASIGIACGARYYILAVAATLIALVVLLGLAPITEKFEQNTSDQKSPNDK